MQLGIPMICAHFFVFYFGILADITPPVALAAFAGSAIAKSRPMKTALNASKIAIAAYIVPFIFAFFPELIGAVDIAMPLLVLNVVMAMGGLFIVAAGLNGYLMGRINPLLRVVAVIGGVLFMLPLSASPSLMAVAGNVIGIASLVVLVVVQKIAHRNDKALKDAEAPKELDSAE